MKKGLIILSLVTILLTLNVFAEKKASLYINEQKVDADVILKDSRTFVPLRVISENLGYKVNYDNNTRGITITKDDDVLKMRVDSNKYTKNGIDGEMDVKTFLKNDRTYVPIRFVGEAFSQEVLWNDLTKSAFIKKKLILADEENALYSFNEFPEYGFYMLVPKEFHKRISISSTGDNFVELRSKLVDEKTKDAGFLGYIVVDKKDNYPYDPEDMTPYWMSDGKIIILDEAKDFIASSGPLYDEMMRCFSLVDSSIIYPLESEFPEAKNIDAYFDSDNNFVYKFGNPRITVTINAKYLKDYSISLGTSTIVFNKNNDRSPQGFILSVCQSDYLFNEKNLISKGKNVYSQVLTEYFAPGTTTKSATEYFQQRDKLMKLIKVKVSDKEGYLYQFVK